MDFLDSTDTLINKDKENTQDIIGRRRGRCEKMMIEETRENKMVRCSSTRKAEEKQRRS